MDDQYFDIESFKPFSESMIWQINRNFYQEEGINAWRKDLVPHHMTSNSMVGKTYAQLIVAFLKDLAEQGKTKETVYILELGAGHGRLAFHILQHLEKLVDALRIDIPPYCYILSDIAENNLDYFKSHAQLQKFYFEGVLDVAYFDAVESTDLKLHFGKKNIAPQSLKQPIVAVANYFFDSIPNDLFLLENKELLACNVALGSSKNPEEMDTATLLKNLELSYDKKAIGKSFYNDPKHDEILDIYRKSLNNSYIFYPKKGMDCIDNLKNLSSEGLMLITMDKGFHEIRDLENKKEPDIVTHGSFSLWVNYHALGAYCEIHNGHALFPTYSTFHLDIGCLMFLQNPSSFPQTKAGYKHSIDDFGPDDFNSLKQLAYSNIVQLDLKQLITFLRASAYDSIFFVKLLPRLKQLMSSITFNERKRIYQTFHKVWEMYFNIDEGYDLAFELGGLFYDLGFYKDALDYFQYSTNSYGNNEDSYYYKAICHYQLRQDIKFIEILKEAKKAFPQSPKLAKLDQLDMEAV